MPCSLFEDNLIKCGVIIPINLNPILNIFNRKTFEQAVSEKCLVIFSIVLSLFAHRGNITYFIITIFKAPKEISKHRYILKT